MPSKQDIEILYRPDGFDLCITVVHDEAIGGPTSLDALAFDHDGMHPACYVLSRGTATDGKCSRDTIVPVIEQEGCEELELQATTTG